MSIWAFDKMDLTKRKHNPVADKTIVEQVFQIMKRDFTVIKDSKACSNIIQIIEVSQIMAFFPIDCTFVLTLLSRVNR